MRFEEEFNNAKSLRDKFQKKLDKATQKFNDSMAEWGSLESMELELKMEMFATAVERTESFMETFNQF